MPFFLTNRANSNRQRTTLPAAEPLDHCRMTVLRDEREAGKWFLKLSPSDSCMLKLDQPPFLGVTRHMPDVMRSRVSICWNDDMKFVGIHPAQGRGTSYKIRKNQNERPCIHIPIRDRNGNFQEVRTLTDPPNGGWQCEQPIWDDETKSFRFKVVDQIQIGPLVRLVDAARHI